MLKISQKRNPFLSLLYAGLNIIEIHHKAIHLGNQVSVTVPDDYVGSVTGYLSSHRGIPKGMVQRGKQKEIVAEAPLAEMFGYVGDLRNLTSGTAIPNMEFSHYAEVPGGITAKILEGDK